MSRSSNTLKNGDPKVARIPHNGGCKQNLTEHVGNFSYAAALNLHLMREVEFVGGKDGTVEKAIRWKEIRKSKITTTKVYFMLKSFWR